MYGNSIDKEIFEKSLTVTELRELYKYMKKLGLLIQKCQLADNVWIEYYFTDEGIMSAICSNNDTDELLKS